MLLRGILIYVNNTSTLIRFNMNKNVRQIYSLSLYKQLLTQKGSHIICMHDNISPESMNVHSSSVPKITHLARK